jgi:hypothetical protein
MSATEKQIQLIELLQNKGATIPSDDGGNPDMSMMDSVQAADAYIKKWKHLFSGRPAFAGRMDELGEVPNC